MTEMTEMQSGRAYAEGQWYERLSHETMTEFCAREAERDVRTLRQGSIFRFRLVLIFMTIMDGW